MSEADEIWRSADWLKKESPFLAKKTCAEMAADFKARADLTAGDPWIVSLMKSWSESFQQCSDFPGPKRTKQVWQWRFKNPVNDYWQVHSQLMPDDGGMTKDMKKHAGPFLVDE